MDHPKARVDVVRETLFGVTMADPYRWMEGEDAEFHEWLDGQGKYTDEYLHAVPERAALLDRVTELTATTGASSDFRVVGDRTFHLSGSVDGEVAVLVVREGGARRVLLDPGTLPGDEHHSIDWHAPSPRGSHVACGIAQGGSENSTLRIIDVATGALLDEAIPRTTHGVVTWLEDGSGFLYHRYRDPDPDAPPAQRRADSGTYLHRLGRPPEEDLLVLARGRNPRVSLSPEDRPFVVLPEGSDWMIAIVSHESLLSPSLTGSYRYRLSGCTIYAAPRSALADPASCPWQLVAAREDGVTAYAIHGETAYLVSHKDAPRSQVFAVSLRRPDIAEARVIVPGSEAAVVAVEVVGEHLLVQDVDGGVNRLRQVALTGGEPQPVPLPVEGVIQEWTGMPGGALLVLASWAQSPRAYRYDASTATFADIGTIEPHPADFSDIEVTELRVPARDGTLIPLSVIHRRGLAMDGSNPTLLTGYGSFGFLLRMLGTFAPEMLAWYERGGVYAIAGMRGGGEYGRDWHEAGRGPNKENTITDFIDCAEYLVAAGYTQPARLAGIGASAGGIPTGGALVRRPDLWAAMVMEVPVTNLTRVEFSENGPMNAPEFGTVATESGLRNLLIIDSYLRIEDQTRYPAVLLTTGLNDRRVAPWQPGKMAARLQTATTSTRPVLLRVDPHSGHGFGSTQRQQNALTADLFAFLLHQFRT